MLLGQNVNSYGKTLDHPVTFAELLTEIEKIDKIKRIRFMTSHPKDLSDELIEVMSRSTKICRHLHLPVQSGSSRILQKMNRRYTKEQYLELTEKIRKAVPGISLTTDIIVGFPGETEEDFQETLDLVRKVRYDSAFTFIYSRRTGTPAASMEDQVPEDVVKDRFQRLLKEVQDIASEVCAVHEGTTQEALVESLSEHDPSMVTLDRVLATICWYISREGEELIGKLVPGVFERMQRIYYLGELPDNTYILCKKRSHYELYDDSEGVFYEKDQRICIFMGLGGCLYYSLHLYSVVFPLDQFLLGGISLCSVPYRGRS